MTILYHYFAERRSHICNNLLNMDMTCPPGNPPVEQIFKNYNIGRGGHPLNSPLQLMEWSCQSFTEELNWWFSTLIRLMRWHAMTDTKTFAETIHIDISIDISFNIYINIGIDSKTLYSVANYWQIKKINFKSYSCSSPLWFLRLRIELKAPNLPPGKMSFRRSFSILAPGGPCMSYHIQ